MAKLPARREPDPARDVTRAERETEVAIYKHHLRGRFMAEAERIDAAAARDALQAAFDEEIGLLDYGLGKAGGSVSKAELVARKVETLSDLNARRFKKRFGG